jgi:hypothetical protein
MAGYDYAASQSALLRQRKMAEMLQAQAFHPTEMPTVPGAKLSPWTIALKGLLGGMSAYQASEADKAAAADAASREAGVSEHMKGMPMDIPGVPSAPIEQEQVGAPPAPPGGPPPQPPGLAAAFGPGGMQGAGVPPKDNEFTGSGSPLAAKLLGGDTPQPNPLTPAPEGPPMLPQPPMGGEGAAPPLLPQKRDMGFPGMIPKLSTDAIPGKEASGEDWLKWGTGFNKYGPEYADVGKAVTASAIKSAMPMSPDVKAELQMKHADKKAELDRQYALLGQQQAQFEQSDKRYRDLEAQREQNRLEVARLTTGVQMSIAEMKRDAAAGRADAEKGTWSDSNRVDPEGRQIMFNNKTGKYKVAGTGEDYTPSNATPVFTGPDQKEYRGAVTNLKDSDLLDNYAKRVGDLKDEFTTQSGLAASASKKYAGSAKLKEVTGHTEEGLKLRGEMESHLARVVKNLMGTAATKVEGDRNALWLPQPGDDAAALIRKMNAAAEEQRNRTKNSTSDKVYGHAVNASKPKAPAAPAPKAAGGDIQSILDRNQP